MQSAKSVVNLMLENQNVRVCANCDVEFGKQPVEPGQQRTHGYCRRHSAQFVDGLPEPTRTEQLARIKAAPESNFCPDRGAPPAT